MLGELAALGSAALWALASILWTRLSKVYSPVGLNFIKCASAVGMLSLTLLLLEGRLWPWDAPPSSLAWLALSGILGLSLGDSAYFVALQRLGPRLALLIWSAAPGLSALLAWPVLGEPIHARMLAGMMLTIGGVTWVLLERVPQPNADRDLEVGTGSLPTTTWSRGRLIGLLCGVGALVGQATSNVLVKVGAGEGGAQLDALDASLVRLLVGSLGLGIYLGASRQLLASVRPLRAPRSAAMTVVAIFLGTYLGIWLMSYGVLHAEVGIASTLNSTSPLFVLPLVVWFEGEKLSRRAILGALIAVSGVGLFFSG